MGGFGPASGASDGVSDVCPPPLPRDGRGMERAEARAAARTRGGRGAPGKGGRCPRAGDLSLGGAGSGGGRAGRGGLLRAPVLGQRRPCSPAAWAKGARAAEPAALPSRVYPPRGLLPSWGLGRS